MKYIIFREPTFTSIRLIYDTYINIMLVKMIHQEQIDYLHNGRVLWENMLRQVIVIAMNRAHHPNYDTRSPRIAR